MAEIILEPTALSKVIPLKFKINDVDVPKTTQLSTNKQFNTTDTDAWFTFELDGLASTSGTYDLTLINLDDKSIFHHDNVLFAALPFHYKLNSSDDITLNEIRHAGRWLGQLVVTMGNGDTTSRQFGFNISGHILDGQDAQVILLSDYQALINIITLAKDELTQNNIDYAALIADVDAAEALRVQTEIDRVTAFNTLVNSAVIEQTVTQEVAEKYQEIEALNAPEMVSFRQQLEQAEKKTTGFINDISNAERYIVEKNAVNHVPNVDTYLTIPTYDGSGLSTHPKVLYFADGWNGYKFWMAHTPYPAENDDYENPCIAVSNDGTTWSDFPSLINPLDTPDPALGYNSDTHLVIVGNTLEIYWRYVLNATGTVTYYKRASTDGLNWTAKQVVFTKTGGRSVSPSIMFDEGKYKMWVLDGTSMPYLDYDYYESADGLTWTKLHTIDFSYENTAGWHGDVIKNGDKYEILTMGINQVTGRSDLYYMFSYDNITYSKPIKILSSRNNTDYFDNLGVYRSTMVVVGDKYYLYYTPINANKDYRIALTIGDSPLSFGVNNKKIELGTYRTSAQDAFKPSDHIRLFPRDSITVTKITGGFAGANGFPESTAGTFITDNTYPEYGRQRQTYEIYNSNKVYVRYTDTSGNWTPFTRPIPTLVSADNAYTPSQAITAFPKFYITKTKISNAFGSANGFPSGGGGLFETDYSISENGYQNQKFYAYANYRVYQRTTKADGTFTPWRMVYGDVFETASRPTDVNAGYFGLDNTLGVPVYYNGSAWKRFDTNATV